MRAAAVVFLSTLAACGGKQSDDIELEEGTVEEPAPPDSPGPYEYEGEPDPPVYDQDAIEEALNAAFRDTMTISGAPPVLGYETLMAGADATCPDWNIFEGSAYWADSCTSETGNSYDGYMFTEVYEDDALMGEGSSMSGTALNGQAVLTAADGTRLDLAGNTYDIAGTIDDGEAMAWMTSVVGAFEWDDPLVEDTWLGGPLQPALESQANQYVIDEAGTKIQVVVVNGGIGGMDSEWSTAYLDSVLMIDEVPGYWTCPVEPAGIVSIRSSDHHWYQVVFDVAQNPDGTYSAPAGTCDGCGTVFRDGEEIGEACADVSPLIDWEDQPW